VEQFDHMPTSQAQPLLPKQALDDSGFAATARQSDSEAPGHVMLLASSPWSQLSEQPVQAPTSQEQLLPAQASEVAGSVALQWAEIPDGQVTVRIRMPSPHMALQAPHSETCQSHCCVESQRSELRGRWLGQSLSDPVGQDTVRLRRPCPQLLLQPPQAPSSQLQDAFPTQL